MRYHSTPMADTIVRFAPSPTGYLHLGGARTALYNYIFARQRGGTFILRIEDTDPSRSTDEAIAQIIRSMREMGLDWDEGPGVPGSHGPYRQTERQAVYHEHIDRLLASGDLYTCFCTPEQLEVERQAAQAEKRAWVYAGTCRGLGADEVERRKTRGEPWTLRFKIPDGRIGFDDILRGRVEVESATVGDFIVQRSDGTITYNLAVVVDDVTMEITDVIRGDDHISNTPKQVPIYVALGAEIPRFLHMPLLFGTDRKKLSKRHGATKLEQLVDMGFLPEVVRNYLCFLSTEFDESMIAWTLDDLVRRFKVEELGTSASIFDPDKLRWMNGRYLRSLDDAALGERLAAYLERTGFFGDPAGWTAPVIGVGEARAAVGALARAGQPGPRPRAARAREDRGAGRRRPDRRLVLRAAHGVRWRPGAARRHRRGGAYADLGRAAPPRPRPVHRRGRRGARPRAPRGARREAEGGLRRAASRDEWSERHAGTLRVALAARLR